MPRRPTSNRPPTTISSMQQADASNFERTLNLGKELASDLKDSDILGRWIAHHIAELIVQAETCARPERQAAESAVAEAIIKLWANRSGLPTRRYPLQSFEPVFAALDRLGQPHSPWGYYRIFGDDAQPSEDDIASVALLKAACTIDEDVREVVTAAVIVAARDATRREAKWLELSRHLAEDQQRLAVKALRRLRLSRYHDSEENESTASTPDLSDDTISGDPDETHAAVRDLRAALDRALRSFRALREILDADSTADEEPRSRSSRLARPRSGKL